MMTIGSGRWRATVAPAAPAEVAWLLDLLVQTAHYAEPALAELDQSLLPGIGELRPAVRRGYERLFRDKVRGCPELLLLAHHANALLEADIHPLLDWLSRGVKRPLLEYELLTEAPADRAPIIDRLERLTGDLRVRRAYSELLSELWAAARPAWQREGRAIVERACDVWRARLTSGAALEDLVAPRHPLIRSEELGLDAVFERAGEIVVSPLYFCMSGGHVADLGDYVLVAVPASDLAPIRKVRDAAFVADRLRVFAEPTRAHILIQLLSAPSGVMELARLLRLSQPTVSGHIKTLLGAGLVQKRRLGARTVFVASRKRAERLLEDARATLARWD